MRFTRFLGAAALAAFFALAALALVVTVLLGRRPVPEGPIAAAAERGDVEPVTVLPDAGAGLEELDCGPSSLTPLLQADHKDQLAAVRRLLARGVDPNRLAIDGNSPLNLAASEGDLALVRTLLAAGARVRGPTGFNALLNAATGGYTPIVEALLKADPGLRVENGPRYWVARFLAHLRGDGAMLALLSRAERP